MMSEFSEIIQKLPSERDSETKIKYFDQLSSLANQDEKKFWKVYRLCEDVLIGFGSVESKIACFQCLSIWVMLRIEHADFNPKGRLISEKLWNYFIEKLKNLSRIEDIPLQLSILRFIYLMFSVECLSLEEERPIRQDKTKYLRKDAMKKVEVILFSILKTTENRVVYRCLCLYSLSILCQFCYPSVKKDQLFFFNALKFVLNEDPIFKRMDDPYDQFVLFGLCHSLLRRKKFAKSFNNVRDISDEQKKNVQILIRECYIVSLLRNHSLLLEVKRNNLMKEISDKNPYHKLFELLFNMVYFPEQSILLSSKMNEQTEKKKYQKYQKKEVVSLTTFFSLEFFQPHLNRKRKEMEEEETRVEGDMYGESNVKSPIPCSWRSLFSQTVLYITPSVSNEMPHDYVGKILSLINHPYHHSSIWRNYNLENSDVLRVLCTDPQWVNGCCQQILKTSVVDQLHHPDEKFHVSYFQSFRNLLLSSSNESRSLIFQFLSSSMRTNLSKFRRFSRTDIKIFTHSSPENIFWDLKKELLNSPHLNVKLQQQKKKSKDQRSQKRSSPYSLKAEDWKIVAEKVQRLKKSTHKNVQMDDIRLECMKELYVEKEKVIRLQVKEIYDCLVFLLNSLMCICEEPMNHYLRKRKYRASSPSSKEGKKKKKEEKEEKKKKKKVVHHNVGKLFSDYVCSHAHLFVYVLFDHFKLSEEVSDLTWRAFLNFRALLGLTFSQNLKHSASLNKFLSRQVAHSTFRNSAAHNIRFDRDCEMFKENNNIRFTSRVVFELRKYVKEGGQMTPESFTCILPFLQCVINHKNLPKRKKRGRKQQKKKKKKDGQDQQPQYQESTFRIALNLLCTHAGHPNVVAKDALTEILLEVIVHIPRLRDQAESTLHELAKLYLPNDLSPLLRPDILFSPFPSIRIALLKTLSYYPPLNSQKNDVLFVQRKKLYFPSHKNIISTLWMTMFDSDEELSKIGQKLWKSYWMKIGLSSSSREEEEVEGEEDDNEESDDSSQTDDSEKKETEEEEYIPKNDPILCEKIEDEIFRFLRSRNEFLRNIASKALAQAVITLAPEERIPKICQRLISSFTNFGQTGRFSVLMTLKSLYEYFGEDEVRLFYQDFVLKIGLTDRIESIRNEVVQSALDSLKIHAKKFKSLVTDIFNAFLKEKGSIEGKDDGKKKKKKKVYMKKKSDDDFVVGNVSTFLGFVAQYHEEESRIVNVMNQLVKTLTIPSNRVQKSCMEALSSLVSTLCSRHQKEGEEERYDIPEKVDELIGSLLKDINKGEDYGFRRGRVYGVTAIIKGAGITIMKKHDIMRKLHHLAFSESVIDRETALMAYELFSCNLVPFFEPYLSSIVPPILFGMAQAQPAHVLSQAERALKELMEHGMSEFSVRLITPKVLGPISASDETFWRVKVGCCKLIGCMASHAPRQLDVTLPIIVNALMGCLSDVKPEVSDAAYHALRRLGSVVKNRNILSILPDLLEAVNNPTRKCMMTALKGILRTKFTHTLDAAAITLLVPVLSRGMTDADVKINLLSAKIIGMICGYLVKNYRILVPYVPKLLEGLRKKLIGEHPEVRATAAKAIGRISKIMFSVDEEERRLKVLKAETSPPPPTTTTVEEGGEEGEDEDKGEDEEEKKLYLEEKTEPMSILDQMLGETMEFINSLLENEETNGIEREGAAMATSEIAAAQGIEYVSKQLNEVWIPQSHNEEPRVREGYLKLFTYLPILMSYEYEPFLKQSLRRTLQGLSDTDDQCRETCYRGSSVMIRYFGIKFVSLILPILLVGLQNEMWRTRLNCLKLLSNLLHNITIEVSINRKKEEVKEKKRDEDSDEDSEDEEKLEPIRDEPVLDLKALESVLTREVTHQILSIIFLTQCDENLTVRSKALFLWRSAIEHKTESVLNEILTTLLNIIIEHLSGESSSSDSLRKMAARGCNILVEKLGGKNIVGRLVPILSQRISEPKKETRVGVCVGISEIMKSSTTGTLRKYSKTLLRVVKIGICDDEREVQVAASHAFNELSKVVGQKEVVRHIVRGLIYDLLSQEKEKMGSEEKAGEDDEEEDEEKEGEERKDEDDEKKKYNCLSGLSQLVKTNPKIVLPVLIPSLLVDDMQDIHLYALGRIAKQSGHLFVDYYEEILRIFLKLMAKAKVLDATKHNVVKTDNPLFFAISRFCQTAHVHKDALEILVDYLEQALSQSNKGRARRMRSGGRPSPSPSAEVESTDIFPVIPASVFLQVFIICLSEFDQRSASHFYFHKGRRLARPPVMVKDKSFKFRVSRTLLGTLMQFMNHHVDDVVYSCSVTVKLMFDKLLDKDERILMLPTLRDHIQKYQQTLLSSSDGPKKRVIKVSSVQKVSPVSTFEQGGQDVFVAEKPRKHLACFRLDVINATFLSLFEIGILSKHSEPKEAAIYGLRYLIELTPPDILQKYVAKAAGRLVRIGGAKLRWQIKIVILETLVTLIKIGGKKILLYSSQFQTIFVKSLQSPTQIIRDQAARALGMLVSLGKARVKKLIIELHSAIKRFQTRNLAYDLNTCSVCVGVMKGLEVVILKQGQKVDKTVLASIVKTIVTKILEEEAIGNSDILRWGSNVIGACIQRIDDFQMELFLQNKTQTQIYMVRGMLKYCPLKLDKNYVIDLLVKVAECTVTDVKEQIQVQAIQLFLPYVIHFDIIPSRNRSSENDDEEEVEGESNKLSEVVDPKVVGTIKNVCASKINVVRYHGFELVKNLSKKLRLNKQEYIEDDDVLNSNLFLFVESVMKGTKDKHTPTKLIAEQAMYYLLKLHDGTFDTYQKYVSQYFYTDEVNPEDRDEKKKLLLKLCKKIQKRQNQQQENNNLLLREEEEEEEF